MGVLHEGEKAEGVYSLGEAAAGGLLYGCKGSRDMGHDEEGAGERSARLEPSRKSTGGRICQNQGVLQKAICEQGRL